MFLCAREFEKRKEVIKKKAMREKNVKQRA